MHAGIPRALVALAAVGVVGVPPTVAGAVPAVTFPKFGAPVVDAAGVVPDNVEAAVNAQLNSYQQRSGNQVAVAVVKTTGAESIETYAKQLFNQWGVGQRSINNGVLLVIAYNDHKLRIEVGDGLRGELNDSVAGAIAADDIVPMMRANNISSAIELGTTAIRKDLGDPLAQEGAPIPQYPSSTGTTPTTSRSSSGAIALVIFIVIFVVIALLGVAGRANRYRSPSVWGPSYGYYRRPRGLWGWGGGFWGNSWGRGSGGRPSSGFGGGLSSGGGGFSSGGGGSSSGGGASGSW